MKTFKVRVTETLNREVEVEAKDINDAENKVSEMYRNEEIVLDSEDFDGDPQFVVCE